MLLLQATFSITNCIEFFKLFKRRLFQRTLGLVKGTGIDAPSELLRALLVFFFFDYSTPSCAQTAIVAATIQHQWTLDIGDVLLKCKLELFCTTGSATGKNSKKVGQWLQKSHFWSDFLRVFNFRICFINSKGQQLKIFENRNFVAHFFRSKF